MEGNTTSRFIAAQRAEALLQAGRIGEGLAVIERAIERSQSDEELWATAELLRIKGELVRMQGIPEASTAAEDQFRQALDTLATARRLVLGAARCHKSCSDAM